MAIAIRTAVVKDGVAHVQAGAGIVADSVPAARARGVRAQGDRRPACGRDGRGDADRHVSRLSCKGVVVLLALRRRRAAARLRLPPVGHRRRRRRRARRRPGSAPPAPRWRRASPRSPWRSPRPPSPSSPPGGSRASSPSSRMPCASPSPPALAVRVILDPDGVLGPVAASRVGRTGLGRDRRRGHGVAVGRAGRLRSSPCSGWSGRSSACGRGAARRRATRCPTPGAPTSPGPGASGSRSDWDELTAGRDPTDVGPDGPT